MKKILLSNLTIYAQQKIYSNASLLIEGGIISAILTAEQAQSCTADLKIEHRPGHVLLPGMIDAHIHGIAGHDVMDATPQALSVLCQRLPAEGTTCFLATTMTQSSTAIEAALRNIAEFPQDESGAQIAGIHLEGPFISPQMLGAHRKEYVLAPDIKLFEYWQQCANGKIKVVTVAPELPGALNFIKYLHDNGVVAAIGHSNASFKQTEQSILAGARHATHLFNAMSGVHHREPGMAAAILLHDEVLAELIVDGHHVCPEMVKFCLKVKGKHSLCLVTDSMRAKCCADGQYDLGGLSVIVQNQQARLSSGALAGSVLKMSDAVNNLRACTQCDYDTVVQLTAMNPAKQLGVDKKKGSIAVKKDADLVVMDPLGNVVLTICRGEISYHKESIN